MAVQTECQTPGTIYGTTINVTGSGFLIDVHIVATCKPENKLPLLTEAGAKLLEANIHNALELVLARYFSNN